MDTRIRIIAEDITKDGVNALNRLIELEKELKIETEAANQAQKNSNTETNKSIGIIKSLEDEIQRLIKLRKESTDTTQIASYNRQIGLQEAELKKLTDTQQKSNALTKEQNAQIQTLTGTTEKSNGMFKNLAATMLGLFAVDRIIDYSKQMFDLVINSDRMNIALKNVTQSNQEYHQSLEFLNKLSNDYGQNVNTLKESYVSFLASSKSTNLSVKERQGIYESIIKAGSALTLSNDAIEGSLRAVSQMFSKGNVSAEELRGQLGERLPGAFGIMAEALGVNEKKLNKMLEQGEVLAEEALPKFAKALEEAYGDKAKSNIDTVTGASNRFGRSLTENLSKINENTGFTKALANGINFLADNFKTLVNVIVGAGAALAAYTLKQVFSNSVAKLQLINLGQEVLAKQAASVATLELTAAETAAAAAAARFNAAMSAAPYGAALIALSALVTMILQHNDAQQRAYELTEAGIKATDEEIKGERAHAVELGITIEQTKKLAYGTEERLTNVRKLMAQYPQYFKDMTAEQVSNWHLTNAYRGVNAEIERKITLLAREKSVQGLTNRAAEIKAELEQLGVFTTNMNEYNKQSETLSNSFKNIRGKILEYNQVVLNLDKTTLRLTDSQKQMFNQEARNNKARLEAGVISEKEFKAEVMRIQEVYGIKVQNYKLEENLLGKSVDNNKKANDKKLSGEKELNKKLKAEKEAFQQKITDIENRGEEERAFERSKHANKIYPIYSQSYDKVQKVLETFNKVAKESGDKISKEMAERITKDSAKIEEIIKKSNEFYEQLKKNAEDDAFVEALWNQIKKQEEKKKELILELKRQLGSEMMNLMNQLLDKSIEHYQKEVDAADGAMKKFFAQQKLNSAKNTADVISGAMDFASGDYVKGSIKIVSGIVKFFDQEFNAYAKALEARASATAERIKRNLDTLLPRLQATISGLEDIEGIYKKVGEDPFKDVTDSLKKLNEMYSTLLTNHLSGIDKMTERANNSALALVDAEIAVGEQIISNWNSAVNKQNDIYTKQKSNQEEIYSTLKSKAQEQFDKDIKDINSKYDYEVAKINAKYDLISVKNSQRFDAESLAIAEGVNNDLMAFVQNQDLKIGLTTEYERRKGEIATTFALAYKPITEGMTEAEIKGINDAKKARDEAFAKLAEWQTGQIKFVIDNGKLEIDTFTDVQKVIAKGKDEQYQLGLKYKNQEIQDDINKGIELDAIEKQRDSDILTRTTAHKANLELIETNHKAAMTVIEENHAATITAINLAKDEAIAASMERLKNFMITAIGDMQNRYAEMVAKGIEGSEAMLESLNKLKDAYNNLYNTPLPGTNDSRGSNTSTPTVNPIPTNTPRFKTGTEMVGGIKGVDKNLAWLSNDEAVLQGDLNKKRLDAGINRFQMVEYAINYKSILDGGFQPLQIKTSALDKLEEHKAMQYLLNMNADQIVSELQDVKTALKNLPINNFVLDENGFHKSIETRNNVTKFKAKRLK